MYQEDNTNNTNMGYYAKKSNQGIILKTIGLCAVVDRSFIHM